MYKIKKKILLLISCAFCAVCCFFTITIIKSSANEVIFGDIHFESEYQQGEIIMIPDMTITCAGETKEAEKTVLYPNGATSTASKIELNIPGEYVVRYSAKIEGKFVYKDVAFSVFDQLYEINSQMAKTSYDAERDSLIATLPSGSTFQYNKVIDLTNKTKDDSLIDLFIISSEDEKPDFLHLFVKLMDVEDPNNYICFRLGNQEIGKSPYDYVLYYAYTQGMVANDASGAGLENKTIHKNNKYGTPVRFSFVNRGYYGAGTDYSVEQCVMPENNSVSLRLDYASKQLWVAPSAYPSNKSLVCDFDDSNYFTPIWNGFNGGKCYLSVYAASYVSSSATIGIKCIEGEKLLENKLVDNTAPELTVDYSNYSENALPTAIVGKAYQLFDYTVEESYGISKEEVKVYFDYYSQNRISVSIVNGKFIPKKAGCYTIEYTVIDKAGNTTRKLVPVYAEEEGQPLSISVTEEINSAVAGYSVKLPSLAIDSLMKYGSVETVITAKNGDIVIEAKDNMIVPMKTGNWEIVYHARNYSGQEAEITASLLVETDGNPVFIDSVFGQLPHYFIANKQYTLPVLYAYKFNDNGYEKVLASVEYEYKGVKKESADGKIRPIVDNSGDIIEIRYKAGETYSTKIEIPVVILKDADQLDMTKLFAVVEGEATVFADAQSIGFTAASDYELEFINSLPAEDLLFNFYFADSNIETFTVSLMDINDSENSISFLFEVRSSGVSYISNGMKIGVSKSLELPISMTYGAQEIRINGEAFGIANCMNGKEFKGFSSGVVYFSVSTQGAKSGNTIHFSQISKQPLSDYEADTIAPSLVVQGELNYYNELNDVTIIKSAIGYDVIDGESDVYVSVRCNGKYLASESGVLLDGKAKANVDYQIKLTEYGEYYISYTVYDHSNADQSLCNSYIKRMSIIVLDVLEPIVSVQGNVKKTAKINERYTFNTFTATDNIESVEPMLGVMIIAPSGTYYYVKDKQYVFNQKGNWIVRYFAVDEVGNFGFIDYQITVS